jgi:hypothetical protein
MKKRQSSQEKYLSKLRKEMDTFQMISACVLYSFFIIGVSIFIPILMINTLGSIYDRNLPYTLFFGISTIILFFITYKMFKIKHVDFLIKLTIIIMSMKKLIKARFYIC